MAVESTVEVALRHEGQRPTWFAAPAIALVVLPLLARRRFPFSAAAATWLLAVAVSFIDGQLVVVPVSAFISEGLTNVLKHANAGEAVVSLGYAPDQLSIDVQDNGRGMVLALGNGHRPGHGLIGIRERVRLYDGEMTTGTPDGGGFLLRVRLPLSG